MNREQREVRMHAERHKLAWVIGGMAAEGAVALGLVLHEAGQGDINGMGLAGAVGTVVIAGTGLIAEKLHCRQLN